MEVRLTNLTYPLYEPIAFLLVSLRPISVFNRGMLWCLIRLYHAKEGKLPPFMQLDLCTLHYSPISFPPEDPLLFSFFFLAKPSPFSPDTLSVVWSAFMSGLDLGPLLVSFN